MSPDPASVVFFGYWSGSLPAVAALHLRSFVARHPQSRYELWLDEDDGSAVDEPSLQWIRTHPRIALRPFSLDALIERHVTGDRPVARYERLGALRRAGLALGQRLSAPWRPTTPGQARFARGRRHSSPLFGGFRRDKAYRADLARCLVPLAHYPGPCVYAEIDTCFCTDLSHHCGDKAWAYRWDRHPFARAALMYLPDRSWSTALVRRGNEIESFLPWMLLTDAHCAELGVTLHPPRMFDPLWDGASLLYGDVDRFFCARDNLALDLHALDGERHLAIHWHDCHRADIAPTSIYAGLLRACEKAVA
ncbi:MAG TPA: hypothetical protein VF457_18715 [Burkholderiaceae bacterium]